MKDTLFLKIPKRQDNSIFVIELDYRKFDSVAAIHIPKKFMFFPINFLQELDKLTCMPKNNSALYIFSFKKIPHVHIDVDEERINILSKDKCGVTTQYLYPLDNPIEIELDISY